MTTTSPGAKLPEPLAVDAAVAERHAGRCHHCHRAILRGQRFAALVPGRQLAHVACIGMAAGTAA